ncbi:hypothetical protein [Pararhodospirillum photometricum]|uniref:hypothetical protein n=1 Tax=Pararhodospirillum photometricum TaxID=1084 RepID=UPI0005A08EA6|nr:hypothetical protein [Pararhodospirillum photometricum]
MSVVFAFDERLGGLAGVTATALEATGRTRGRVTGLADLCLWPSGGLAGVRLSADAASLLAFRQAGPGLAALPSAVGPPFVRLARPRLWPWGGEGFAVCGLQEGVGLVLASPAWDQAPTVQPLGSVVTDPETGSVIGALAGDAGLEVLGETLFVATHTTALPASEGWAPLGVETSTLGLSRRLVEAPPEQGDGLVVWRTTAVAAWAGRFWVAATRRVGAVERHRLYSLVPGGAPGVGFEMGGVDGSDSLPWGLMVQAAEPEGAPAPEARIGGLWAGDRLVIGVVPAAVDTASGRLSASGQAGVYVVGADLVPVFRALPTGQWLAGAVCLGNPAQSLGAALWLCRLLDAQGGARMALTRDFLTWSVDPEGVEPVALHAGCTVRWGWLA